MFWRWFGPRRPSASSIRVACKKKNPFINDLVIEVMLEEAGVDTLKTLREMNTNWNKLDLKELEKRALEGQLSMLNFFGSQEKLDKFFKSTAAIPQVFVSFCLKFPSSFSHSSFAKYTPIFLRLELNNKLEFTPRLTKYLLNIFRWFAPTLQEIEVAKSDDSEFWIPNKLTPFSIPPPDGAPLVFRMLTKLIWTMDRSSGNSFQFLLDKFGTIDPTPNLTTLEASIDEEFLMMINGPKNLLRWSQLSILRLYKSSKVADRFTSTLLALEEAGMRLKVFAMCYNLSLVDGSPEITRNWSQFLATQAQSLQVLELEWIFEDEDSPEDMVDPAINLPIFSTLQTLHLFFYYGAQRPVQTRMFKGIQIPIHFPKLDNLHVNQQGFLNLFPRDGVPIRLQTLAIDNKPFNLQAWNYTFPLVESLKCEGSLFNVLRTEVPWWECLKVLEIDDVKFPLKVSHLTSLRELIVREWQLFSHHSPEEYLTFFEQVLALKLSSITFKFWNKSSEEVKTAFKRHFPFPVNFNRMTFVDAHHDHFPFNYES